MYLSKGKKEENWHHVPVLVQETFCSFGYLEEALIRIINISFNESIFKLQPFIKLSRRNSTKQVVLCILVGIYSA